MYIFNKYYLCNEQFSANYVSKVFKSEVLGSLGKSLSEPPNSQQPKNRGHVEHLTLSQKDSVHGFLFFKGFHSLSGLY